jgi:hypothetical protein
MTERENLLDRSDAGVIEAAIIRALYELRVDEATIEEILDRLRGRDARARRV